MARYSLTFIAISEKFSALVYETQVQRSNLLTISVLGNFTCYVILFLRFYGPRLGQYPAILTELAWLIKYLLHGIRSAEKHDLRTCLFSRAEKETSQMLKSNLVPRVLSLLRSRERTLGTRLAKVMVMARAPISWLDKCRKYNHLIGYIFEE